MIAPADKPRLSRQCAAILARLQQGPATNAELGKYALNYTARISQLREDGHVIDCEKFGGGRAIYTLAAPAPKVERSIAGAVQLGLL